MLLLATAVSSRNEQSAVIAEEGIAKLCGHRVKGNSNDLLEAQEPFSKQKLPAVAFPLHSDLPE